jgi:ankyrin repeat protein
MIAAAKGHLSTVILLIEKGKVDPLEKNRMGKNPLIFACLNGQIHIVSYLLRLGVNPNMYLISILIFL